MSLTPTAPPLPFHPSARIGAVHLTVRDLERSLAFYQQNLGLRLLDREGPTARLGAASLEGGDRELLVLTGDPAARPAPGTTGLYHFALLTPSRPDLARALERLIETRTQMSGASDHGVSEALYLSDPDQNGIEIYRDRQREKWPWQGDRLAMTTEPLDLRGLLAEADHGTPGMDAGIALGTTMGHVHLHVGDLDAAHRTYARTLGMGVMQRYGPSALFVSAGGYHHHVGLNTWQGVGAPPPPPGATGLRHFELVLPDADEVARLGAQLEEAGVEVERREDGAFFRDPSRNGVLLRT